MRTRSVLVNAFLALVLFHSESRGAILIGDPSDPTVMLNRIEGLTVLGVTYNVDFTRVGETFNDIFGAGDPPATLVPTFYNDAAGAEAAEAAILAAIVGSSFRVVGDGGAFGRFIDVPSRNVGSPTFSFAAHTLLFSIGPGGSWLDASDDQFSRFSSDVGIPIFTRVDAPVVPEPSTVFAWCLVAAVFGGGCWVRRRQFRSVS